MFGAKRGGHRALSRIIDVNLDCAFVENVLFYINTIILVVRGVPNFGRARRPWNHEKLNLKCTVALLFLNADSFSTARHSTGWTRQKTLIWREGSASTHTSQSLLQVCSLIK